MATETATEVLSAEADLPTLTAMDRCDSCGAQAYAYVLFEHGELNFCGHHFTAFSKKLPDSVVKIVDETYRISSK